MTHRDWAFIVNDEIHVPGVYLKNVSSGLIFRSEFLVVSVYLHQEVESVGSFFCSHFKPVCCRFIDFESTEGKHKGAVSTPDEGGQNPAKIQKGKLDWFPKKKGKIHITDNLQHWKQYRRNVGKKG